MDKKISLKLAIMTLAAAVLVVFIHTPMTSAPGFSMWLEDLFGCKIALVAVPFFFVASGYLLANRMESQGGGYYIQLKKRVQSLLVPYLFWCLALGLQANLNSILANITCHYPLMRHIDLNPIHMFGMVITKHPPFPLWFVRALMLYVIVSPALLWFARRKYMFVAFVVTLVAFTCTKNLYVPNEYTMLFNFTLAPVNVLAFTLGLRLSSNPIQISKRCGSILLASGLLLFFLLSLLPAWQMSIPYAVRAMLVPLAIVMVLGGAWVVCPAIELPRALQGLSFPIYLLHAVFVPYIFLLAGKFPAMLAWYGYVMNGFLLLICSMSANYILHRWVPKFRKVIFGGR